MKALLSGKKVSVLGYALFGSFTRIHVVIRCRLNFLVGLSDFFRESLYELLRSFEAERDPSMRFRRIEPVELSTVPRKQKPLPSFSSIFLESQTRKKWLLIQKS